MPSRSQRHLRDIYGSDSAGESSPGVTAVRAPTSITDDADEVVALTVTLTNRNGGPVPGAWVGAASANAAVATVAPAKATTNGSGVATFAVTCVATGGPVNVTFTSSTDATIAAVPVTVN
jgi:hypothetical protein